VSFEEAITSGYAPDGGLFVPTSLPRVSPYILKLWSRLDYPHLAFSLLRLFIDAQEIPDDDLYQIISTAFVGSEAALFDDPQYIPIRDVGGPAPQVPCLHMVELFHGPTQCFKDFGLRALIGMLSYFSTRRTRPITLLVATTGDTGPAAVRAVRDYANPLLNLVVHYPQGQISEYQRRQLLVGAQKQGGGPENVKVVAFEGGGDDVDANIKTLLRTQQKTTTTAADGSTPTQLTGVNSYNIGRPLVQMVHFLYAYLRVAEKMEKQQQKQPPQTPLPAFPPLDIVVPTGAMGNLAAGYMVKKMGVPIGRLVAAVNSNDVTHRIFATGQFVSLPQMNKTMSEAINIQNPPYNLERILFYSTGGHNHQLIQQWMTQHEAALQQEQSPPFTLPLEFVQHYLQQEFYSSVVTDVEMVETLKKFQGQFGYLADPNTAVAVCVAMKLGYPSRNHPAPTALMATAAPCKFQEVMTAALGVAGWNAYLQSPDFPASAKELYEMPPDEVPPDSAFYAVIPGQSPTSQDTQAQWLEQTKSLIAELAASHGNAQPVYGAPQQYQPPPVPEPKQEPPVEEQAPEPAASMPPIVEVGSEMEKSAGVVTPVASMSFGGVLGVESTGADDKEPAEATVTENKTDDDAAALSNEFSALGVSSEPDFSMSTDAGIVGLDYDPTGAPEPEKVASSNDDILPATTEPASEPAISASNNTAPAPSSSDPFDLPSPDKLPPMDSEYGVTTMPAVVPLEEPGSLPNTTDSTSNDMPGSSDILAPNDLFAAPPAADLSVPAPSDLPAPNDLFAAPPAAELPAPTADAPAAELPSPATELPSPAVELPPPVEMPAPQNQTPEPAVAAPPPARPAMAPAPSMMAAPAAADDDDPFAFLSPPSSAPMPAATGFSSAAETSAPAPYSMPAPAADLAFRPATSDSQAPPIVSTVSSESDNPPIVTAASSESMTMMVMGAESHDTTGASLDRGQAPADPFIQADSQFNEGS